MVESVRRLRLRYEKRPEMQLAFLTLACILICWKFLQSQPRWLPGLPASSLHDLLTIFLNGSGGILNVVNGTGGSATSANPDTPVTVVSYP